MTQYSPSTFGRNAVRASEVPPPLHPDLRDEELARLAHAHADIDEPTQSRRYARAVANADPSDIEAGRLLILHMTREIGARLSSPVRGIETDGDPFSVVRHAMLVVAQDAEAISKLVESGPRRPEYVRLLLSALDVLAEARTTAGILADAFPSDPIATAVSTEAADQLVRARARAAALGAVAEASDSDLAELARARLMRQVYADLEPAGPGEMRRVERLVGNWFLLVSAMPRPGMRREASNGLLQPLSTRDALNLRRAAASVANAFATLRDAPGFLGLLRHLSMGDRYRQAAATGVTVFQGSPLANLIQLVRNELRAGLPARPVLVLRREPGGIAGRFEDGERLGIAILDDHAARLAPRYPEAVRVVPLAAQRRDLPTLEEAREIGIGLAFRTLEDALACIETGDHETARLFFEGDYAVRDRIDEPMPEQALEPSPESVGPSPR